jgi:hypothetical protein
MTDDSAGDLNAISPELLCGMAAAVGVSLTGDRAAALAPQAELHFAQLSHLDTIADSRTEPAGELRLDRGSAPGSD